MPGLDGFQMLEQIRKSSSTSSIPVIFLTAEDTYPAMRKGMGAGAEDYLVKPVSVPDLLASVDVQLQKRAVLEEKQASTLRLLRKNITYALPHELRTPLHLISGYARIIEMDKGRSSPEDLLDIARTIGGASTRLEQLIENYLILAQLELIYSDPVALEAAHNHIVKNSASVIESVASNRAQKYAREDDLQLDLMNLGLRISEQNLSKIVLELVDNAFKFSKPDSRVLVRSVREDDQFYISVHDEGRGMSPDETRLLGAYMQFGRDLYEQQGLGLGYTVAKRLVQLHKGAIRIESQPNDGTVVSLRFSMY
jgi:signal transduction histidine kinase